MLQGAGAAPKKRRALLQALAGSYGAAAAQPAGSYFVEKCYALAVSRHFLVCAHFMVSLFLAQSRTSAERAQPVGSYFVEKCCTLAARHRLVVLLCARALVVAASVGWVLVRYKRVGQAYPGGAAM